ncbi:helix-turn-helix domain-containing protein [Brevundimonas sp.]|jgi:TetR/AcrR family transcriptional repressor of nem operon|uniref:TetR/AcrR family transcriptional regulator n=1 Tax=Brevundimonas sp. TaxID=1871086 RepID=UPI002E104233|nr:helix-turn-helix domain-containing protein [Brevundimonas sp.]
MKVDRETKSANREALLSAASRLLRDRGVDGVGVAEISQAAGLTHGGFYRHFRSKDAMVAASIESTLMEQAEHVAIVVAEHGLDAFVQTYLSPAHLGDRASGCAIAALGGDMTRQGSELRAAYARGVRAYLDVFAPPIGPDRAESLKRLAALIGAAVLARGLAGVDGALATDILDAVRDDPTAAAHD